MNVARPEAAKVPVTDVFSERDMFPVVLPPRVNVWLAVVAKLPAAVKYAAPVLPAETEATGVPPATFRTANLAEVLEIPPIRRSRVLFVGDRVPVVVLSTHLL